MTQDVANGHGPVGEQDVREVMFGQHARGDGAGHLQTGQSRTGQGLWVTLGLSVLDRVLKVDVRVWGAMTRAGRVETGRAGFVRRQGGRDGLRRSEELCGKPGRGSVAGVGITMFRDVDGVGFGCERRSDDGDGVNSGRRHVGGEKVDDYLLLRSVSQQGVTMYCDQRKHGYEKEGIENVQKRKWKS